MTDEQLCKNVQSSFERNLAADKKAASLLEKISAGKGNYVTAGDYAERVGESLRKAYQTNLSGIDGPMHWSTAKAVIEPTLKEEYDIVSGVAADVQQALNTKAGMGLKAVKASYNSEAVSGIMNKVCSYESYDRAAWVLRDDSVSFARSVVDQTLKENINFQGKAGRAARVIRRAEAKCCDWCADLDGIYEYPNTPEDIYRRHDNCRCDVEYDPGTGKLQNVHTKEWRDADERDRIEERKEFGLDSKREKEQLKTLNLDASSSNKIITGARITDPDSPAAQKHAETYYGLVRSMSTDVAKISKNTGIEVKNIENIKQYLFYDKHDLGGTEQERFASDFAIAESWQRLIEGNPEQHDLTLLHHELTEIRLTQEGMSQYDAHIRASRAYNYSREVDEFYAAISEHKK